MQNVNQHRKFEENQAHLRQLLSHRTASMVPWTHATVYQEAKGLEREKEARYQSRRQRNYCQYSTHSQQNDEGLFKNGQDALQEATEDTIQ